MALAQCPRSGGSIPSGGFLRATRRRAQARAAMYISRGDRLSVVRPPLSTSLTEAVRHDARRRPGVAAPRKPILRTVAPLI